MRWTDSRINRIWKGGCAVGRDLEDDLLGWELPPIVVARLELPVEPDAAGAWCVRCGQTIGAGEANRRGCASCRGHPTSLAALVRLGEYGGPLAARILGVKHANWPAMGQELGRELARQTRASIEPALWPEAVVPIPMPWLRRWWRGIDHARVIADAAARELHVPCVPLLKQRLGPTQAGQTRTERQRARDRVALKRWACRGMARLRSCRVVALVDDVRTTGATVEQAARLLHRLGVPTVIAMVVAVAANPRRRVSSVGQSHPRWGKPGDGIGTSGRECGQSRFARPGRVGPVTDRDVDPA